MGQLNSRAIVSEHYLHQMIAENLLSYRQGRNVDQEALADILGVAPTYVAELERGEHNLTLASVERLARRLEIDVLDLLSPSARRAGPASESS